jgi:hypothetical protein
LTAPSCFVSVGLQAADSKLKRPTFPPYFRNLRRLGRYLLDVSATGRNVKTFSNLDQWATDINKPLKLWLLEQVNEQLRRARLIAANQQWLKDGSIKEYALGSPEFPERIIVNLLVDPLCSPFVGYSLLVSYLRNTGRRLDEEVTLKVGAGSSSTRRNAVYMPARRNLIEEAWEFMENDGKRTVDDNSKCLAILNQFERDWKQYYDRTLLARLSFVPRLQWGLRTMRVLQQTRATRARWIRRYSNPRTSLENDPLVTDNLQTLSRKEQLKALAERFRVIPEKSQRRILEAIGIDRKSSVLSQGVWRLILPPFVDYLLLLQGPAEKKPNRERAYKEASQILSARYPEFWPHSPRRVKYSAPMR